MEIIAVVHYVLASTVEGTSLIKYVIMPNFPYLSLSCSAFTDVWSILHKDLSAILQEVETHGTKLLCSMYVAMYIAICTTISICKYCYHAVDRRLSTT